MRYLNSSALGALAALGLVASAGATVQHRSAGAPSVAPIGEAAAPADLPGGAGPSGTSGTSRGPARFDQVGYAAIRTDGARGAIAVWGAGLPRGFAEVTDLASGRTVLVKTDDAPARPGFLAEISPGAAKLLGLSGAAPARVRIREVQPIAADQVALEQGRPAAPRLDAPPILLTGLRAQMAQVPAPGAAGAAPSPGQGGVITHLRPPPPGATAPTPAPSNRKVDIITTPRREPGHAAIPAAQPAKEPHKAAAGRYSVRVGAFSNEANARRLAASIDGHVSQSGKYWRVELGPFADSAAAKRARDGVAKRGYGDARVVTD